MYEQNVYYIPFFVDEKPYCVWDHDLVKANLDFIQSIDPQYFNYVASVHEPALDGDEKQYAALALRIAYSQGLETLFALLCALVQAPECVAAWMVRYQNRELANVVRNIHNRLPVKSRLAQRPITWEMLSALVHDYTSGDAERDRQIQERFAGVWARFASDFISKSATDEYNSLKHGLRARLGGTTYAIGLEATPGVPASPEAMRVIGSSKFGTTFYYAEGIEDNRVNIRVKSEARNWSATGLAAALHLISASIANILTFLKIRIYGADPATLHAIIPTDDAFFDAPWAEPLGMQFRFNPPAIRLADIRPFTADDIHKSYDKKGESSITSE